MLELIRHELLELLAPLRQMVVLEAVAVEARSEYGEEVIGVTMRVDSRRKKPTNFQQAVALILDQMFRTMVERQRKYGTRNIRNLGVLGVLERGARDKMERLFQFYEREDLRRRCLEAGIPPEVVNRYLPSAQADYQDETLEDAHIDAGNYVTVIALMLLRGWWGLPLAETDISLADALTSVQEEER